MLTSKYRVTKTQTFVAIVYAYSEDDAEYDAIEDGEFEFVDEDYDVEEIE